MANKYVAPSEGWSQAKQRSVAIWYDQHTHPTKAPQGRPFWSIVENAASGGVMPMPVGELTPMDWEQSGIFAPWMPDMKYITARIGQSKPGLSIFEHRFKIDYQQMLTDFTAATRAYYERAVREARSQNLKVPRNLSEIPFELEIIVGTPPKSPKIPEAAMSGDAWLLGFDQEENEQLARYLKFGTAQVMTFEQAETSVSRDDERAADLQRQVDELKLLVRMGASVSDVQGEMSDRYAKRRPGKPKSQTVG